MTIILFQGCTVYKLVPVTLDEALKSNTKVRVKTFDNQTLKFKRIEVLNNETFGIKIKNGERIIVSIEKDNIEKIQVKDKSGSIIITIALPIIVIGVVLLIVSENIDYGTMGLVPI